MFPSRLRKGKESVVLEGLPSLLQAMHDAKINTPRRVAAFLTTLLTESWLEYNVRQVSDARPYAGRGYIQLTGKVLEDGSIMNYTPAGKYLGIDLVEEPDLALDIRYSAKIAVWYWTKARPKCNEWADNNQMGKINGAIGYPRSADGSNDNARCLTYQMALQYLTKGALEHIDCNR